MGQAANPEHARVAAAEWLAQRSAMHDVHLCLAALPQLTITTSANKPIIFTMFLTAKVSAKCISSPFSACKQPWSTYQKVCLHSLEHAALHVRPHNCALVDHGEAVAHRHCLLQPVAPAQSALLDGLELPFVHRQHTSQLSLHPNHCFAMSGCQEELYACFMLCGVWQHCTLNCHVLMAAALSFR